MAADVEWDWEAHIIICKTAVHSLSRRYVQDGHGEVNLSCVNNSISVNKLLLSFNANKSGGYGF